MKLTPEEIRKQGLSPYYHDTLGVLGQPEAVSRCRKSTYLGQYDFTAGLPKEATDVRQ